jgi:hypothetical protein
VAGFACLFFQGWFSSARLVFWKIKRRATGSFIGYSSLTQIHIDTAAAAELAINLSRNAHRGERV